MRNTIACHLLYTSQVESLVQVRACTRVCISSNNYFNYINFEPKTTSVQEIMFSSSLVFTPCCSNVSQGLSQYSELLQRIILKARKTTPTHFFEAKNSRLNKNLIYKTATLTFKEK